MMRLPPFLVCMHFMHCVEPCRESDITKERIQKLLKAGANVILTTKGIDDMSLKVRPATRAQCSKPLTPRRRG